MLKFMPLPAVVLQNAARDSHHRVSGICKLPLGTPIICGTSSIAFHMFFAFF